MLLCFHTQHKVLLMNEQRTGESLKKDQILPVREEEKVMAVKKIYSNKEKPGGRWDAAKKQFWSWGFDIRLGNGARCRESGFASRQIAEQAVAQIRVSEKEGKYDLQTRKFPFVADVLERRLERIESKKERVRAATIFSRWLSMLPKRLRFNELAPAHIQALH